MADLLPYQDPGHPYNGEKFRSGKQCINGCSRPAGTAWSPHWCQPCNQERMDGITASLENSLEYLASKEARDGSR